MSNIPTTMSDGRPGSIGDILLSMSKVRAMMNAPAPAHTSEIVTVPCSMPQTLDMTLSGIEMVVSEMCVSREQVRFPKSKKKRIRKKWAKRDENYRYVPMAYHWRQGSRDNLLVHPAIAKAVAAALNRSVEAMERHLLFGDTDPSAPPPRGFLNDAAFLTLTISGE